MVGGILFVFVNGWTSISKGDFNVSVSFNLTAIKIVSHLRFSGDPSLRGMAPSYFIFAPLLAQLPSKFQRSDIKTFSTGSPKNAGF